MARLLNYIKQLFLKLKFLFWKIMTTALIFEGAGSVTGLMPQHIVMAVIYYDKFGHKIIQITDWEGNRYEIAGTDNNIASVALCVPIYESSIIDASIEINEILESMAIKDERDEFRKKFPLK